MLLEGGPVGRLDDDPLGCRPREGGVRVPPAHLERLAEELIGLLDRRGQREAGEDLAVVDSNASTH